MSAALRAQPVILETPVSDCRSVVTEKRAGPRTPQVGCHDCGRYRGAIPFAPKAQHMLQSSKSQLSLAFLALTLTVAVTGQEQQAGRGDRWPWGPRAAGAMSNCPTETPGHGHPACAGCHGLNVITGAPATHRTAGATSSPRWSTCPSHSRRRSASTPRRAIPAEARARAHAHARHCDGDVPGVDRPHARSAVAAIRSSGLTARSGGTASSSA